jgi:hypothetical protein
MAMAQKIKPSQAKPCQLKTQDKETHDAGNPMEVFMSFFIGMRFVSVTGDCAFLV